jgi:GntR family transcriptional regulator
MLKLDKCSPVPLYYQLAELLQEQIHAGILTSGAQLPSERELSDQAAISRMTVRQALAYLVRTGALEVKPGVGTFVAQPKFTHDTQHLLGFTEEMMRQGGAAHSRVLEQAIIPAPKRVATGLGLSPGVEVVKIVRLRLSGETPLLLETSFVPAALCPGLERVPLATRSLYAILAQHYDLRLDYARQTIEATIANEFEIEMLGISLDTAMILLEGVAYDDHEHPVEYFKAIYRGDRFRFEMEGQRQQHGLEIAGASRMNVVLK